MDTISIAEAGKQLSQIVNRASYGHEVLVLTSRGKPKAVLVGIDTFEQILGIHKIPSAFNFLFFCKICLFHKKKDYNTFFAEVKPFFR